MKKEKVYLVTGGCGFIGTNFIHYLLERYSKIKIINLDCLTYSGNPANHTHILNDKRYEFVKGDICDISLVNSLVKDVDYIVHFAAESHVDRSIESPLKFVKTNVEGTEVLLEAAVKYKIERFHHISTDEVFGDLPLDNKNIRFTEKTPYAPSSPYSATKAAADHLVRAFGRTYGLNFTISNTSNNFGPYQYPEKLIPLVILKALSNEKIPVYGDGKNVRDWIFVYDHVRAIDLIINKGLPSETYLVSAENEISNLELVKKILKIMKASPELIKFVKDRPGHDRRYAIDPSKIKNELDFKVSYSFSKALNYTVNWYLENRNWWQDLKKDALKRRGEKIKCE